MKRIYLAAALITAGMAFVTPLDAVAQKVNVNIVVPVAPPPVIVETTPPPRSGFLWVPGYWMWDGSTHVWTQGHWIQVREGHRYDPPAWRKNGEHWHFYEGGWKPHKKSKKHPVHGNGHFCPPGQAKKGNC